MIDPAELERVLGKILNKKVVEATQKLADKIGENTPEESGHAHQIWQGAFNRIRGVRVDYPLASNDKLANETGSASARLAGYTQEVTINTNAPFIRTIEYGGIMRPIRPGGTKQNSNAYPGPFMGKRFANDTGWLCWRDKNGELKFATEVNYRAKRPVKRAIEQVAQEMRGA